LLIKANFADAVAVPPSRKSSAVFSGEIAPFAFWKKLNALDVTQVGMPVFETVRS